MSIEHHFRERRRYRQTSPPIANHAVAGLSLLGSFPELAYIAIALIHDHTPAAVNRTGASNGQFLAFRIANWQSPIANFFLPQITITTLPHSIGSNRCPTSSTASTAKAPAHSSRARESHHAPRIPREQSPRRLLRSRAGRT